jgi:hypothetical protein
MSIEVKGLKENLVQLNKLNPKLRREFGKRIKQIAQPTVEAIERNRLMGDQAPKGFQHNGRTGIGRSKSVIVRTNTRRARGRNIALGAKYETIGTIVVQSRDAALAIMDMAGKANNVQSSGRSRQYPGRPDGHALVGQGGYMIRKLNQYGQASRFMWRSAETSLGKTTEQMQELAQEVEREVNRELAQLGFGSADLKKVI